VIVVDAGNLLFKKTLSDGDIADNTSSLIIAHGLVRAYHSMSYDAVAISANDLSAGLDFFRSQDNDAFPWIAANVYDKDHKQLFLPHIIKKVSNLTIGIIGLTGGTGESVKDFVIGDWREALQREITLLKTSCDMLIVLSSLNTHENNEIQRDFNLIDIIVTANQNGTNVQPQVSQNSLLVQSGNRGKYLGKVDITRYAAGNWIIASTQSLANLKNRLGSIDWQLSQLENQQRGISKFSSQKIVRLQSYRQTILDQITVEREKELSKSFKSSFLPVRPMSSSQDITIIVQDIKNSINTFNRYRRAGLQPDDPALRLALQKDEINGWNGCVTCHKKQTEFWKSTRHANAYTTLSRQGQSFNLQCLPCHVTGGKVSVSSDESKQLFLLSLSPDRQTIGCEVCHGPGKHHLLTPDEVVPVRRPPAEVCTQCHTPDRDNNFNYQKKLAKIACPAG
jgi:hypothetical protein